MSADPPVSECRKSGVEQVVSLPDLPSSVSKEEEDEETLPDSEILDIFEEGLAQLVQDPLLCDPPNQVNLEEVNSQIALEYGQAMTVRVLKTDGEIMPIVVVQNATILDLKKAICRFMGRKQQREGGVKQVRWGYVWRSFLLVFQGEKLDEDKIRLKDYGISNMDEVTFMKRRMKKVHTGHTPDGQYYTGGCLFVVDPFGAPS
ncbi:U11/U12 small nuclear ribonucleoprotein [Dissostichus eleginoides]|nr:U11/U12 small nuclear ribonucleoprotein [Dissostichus eleginoides]